MTVEHGMWSQMHQGSVRSPAVMHNRKAGSWADLLMRQKCGWVSTSSSEAVGFVRARSGAGWTAAGIAWKGRARSSCSQADAPSQAEGLNAFAPLL